MAHSPENSSWSWAEEDPDSGCWDVCSEEERAGWGTSGEGEEASPADAGGAAGSQGPAAGAAPGVAADGEASEGGADSDWGSGLEQEEGSPSQRSGGGHPGPGPSTAPGHDSATGRPVGGAGAGGGSHAVGAEACSPLPGPLHRAAAAGDLRQVRALLAAGADVNMAALPRDETPLHMAAEEGHGRVVEALLAAGADPRALTLSEHTPLMLAASGAHAACFQPLLAAGADIQAEDEDGWTCLHHWAAWAALNPESDQALHALRALLDAGCDAAWSVYGSGTALDMLLQQHLGYVRTAGQPLTRVPEMVRLLAAAGCPVDADPAAEYGEVPLETTALQSWLGGLRPSGEPEGCCWPVAVSAEALAVSAELLRCAPPRPFGWGAAHLLAAISIGDLRLVGLVLEAFPESMHWRGGTALSGAVGWACDMLCNELPDHDNRRLLAAGQWDLEDACPVLHGCKLVAALLAAGAPVQKVVLADERYCFSNTALRDPPRLRQLEMLASIPGPVLQLWVPVWALGPLSSFLPLVAAGIEWIPQHHAFFPPAFRRAARTLLLINECRWRPTAGHGGSTARTANPSTALFGYAPRRARPMVQATWLPSHLLHHVLLLASRPLPAWVPELAPFVQQAGLE